jgi:hypothetical protein
VWLRALGLLRRQGDPPLPKVGGVIVYHISMAQEPIDLLEVHKPGVGQDATDGSLPPVSVVVLDPDHSEGNPGEVDRPQDGQLGPLRVEGEIVDHQVGVARQAEELVVDGWQ